MRLTVLHSSLASIWWWTVLSHTTPRPGHDACIRMPSFHTNVQVKHVKGTETGNLRIASTCLSPQDDFHELSCSTRWSPGMTRPLPRSAALCTGKQSFHKGLAEAIVHERPDLRTSHQKHDIPKACHYLLTSCWNQR